MSEKEDFKIRHNYESRKPVHCCKTCKFSEDVETCISDLGLFCSAGEFIVDSESFCNLYHQDKNK